MNQNANLPREKLKTILIIALLITVVVLLLVILFREPETRIVYQTDPASQQSNTRNSEVSPYVKNEVRNTIAKKWKAMNACYNSFLESTPPPKVTDGMITLDWQVDGDGNVISPEVVSSQIDHPVLEECLIGQVKSWRFPPPPPTGRNAYVVYKFNFRKEQ